MMFDRMQTFLINPLVLFIIGLSTFFYLFSKYFVQRYWEKRGVYSPPCHWFFGHFKDAFLLKKSFAQIFKDAYDTTSSEEPIIGIYLLQKPFLIIRDPELIKQMFIKDFNFFCNRLFASKSKTDIIGSANLFSIDNPQWRYLRTKLSPAFSASKLQKFVQIMLKSAGNMGQFLKSQISDDGEIVTIDCRQLSDKYTTDVITTFAFGIQTDSYVNTELYERGRVVFNLSFKRAVQTLAVFFFPKLNDYILNGSFLDTSTDYFRKVFWESMAKREESKIKGGDIIDLLIELKNEKQQQEEFKFEGDYLVGQAAIILFAGIETSAVTMAFTLLELAKNPGIQSKARKEIRETLDRYGLNYEAVTKMTYLAQVISETLRMYPPVPIIDRKATEDYKIPNTQIIIEKGTAVYAVVNGLHRNPLYHENPNVYDPDRFSEERKHDIKSCTYIPFGEGPRICIGMRIGQLQSIVGLITILDDYEISLNPQYETRISMRSLILSPEDGVKLHFKKIKK